MGIERTTHLFQRDAHNPSFELIRSTLPEDNCPIDFCVPVNRHFPPAHLLNDIRRDLPDIVKYYPGYADLLSNHGLLIRECSNKLGSTEQYLRLAVNLPDETDQLVRALTLELSTMH